MSSLLGILVSQLSSVLYSALNTYLTEKRDVGGSGGAVLTHLNSCLPPPTIVRFLFSTPYLFDREKRCGGFGGCSAPASEFLSPN